MDVEELAGGSHVASNVRAKNIDTKHDQAAAAA
jgi:hypothetical protein